MLLPQIDCFPAIGGFANDSHVRFAPNQRDQPFTNHSVVVGDENVNAGFFRRGLGGSSSCACPRNFSGRRSVPGTFANVFLLGSHVRTVSTVWKPSFLLGLDS